MRRIPALLECADLPMLCYGAERRPHYSKCCALRARRKRRQVGALQRDAQLKVNTSVVNVLTDAFLCSNDVKYLELAKHPNRAFDSDEFAFSTSRALETVGSTS